MKVLVSQPIHEKGINKLEEEILKNPKVDIVIFPEGYLSNEDALEGACQISKKYGKTIITGYWNQYNKDRAVIMNRFGEKILERAKTPEDEGLFSPSVVCDNGLRIGYLLCREILKGLEGLKNIGDAFDFIAHPIGVGMFSEEQFEQWINEAKAIAKKYNTMVIGTSHADGSYRNCGVSIPISYCIDKNGEAIFISKADIRKRIINLVTKDVRIVD